jgi:hypothetical protein
VSLWPGIEVEALAIDYLDFTQENLARAREAQLMRFLLAAQKTAERYTRRRFSPDPPLADDGSDTNPMVTKRFAVTSWDDSIRITDCRVTPEPLVLLDNVALVEGSFGFEPDSEEEPATYVRLAERPLFSAQGGVLSVTGRFGWNPISDDLIDAVYTLAARRYRERQSNHADSVQLPEGLTLAYFRQLPASVQATFDFLRVPHFAVIGGADVRPPMEVF